MTDMNIRNTLIDTARGLGIIIVCVYHLVYRPENNLADKIVMEGIWFVLPAFFFLSGYLYKHSRHSLLYRVKALLIPSLEYTFSLLVIGGAYCILFHGYNFMDCVRDSVLTYLRPEFTLMIFPEGFIPAEYWNALLYDVISPVWFIWTLLFTLPVFYALMNYKHKLGIIIILLALSVCLYDYSNYFSWNLTLVPFYAAVMLAGSCFSGAVPVHHSYLYALIAFILHLTLFAYCGSPRAFMNEVGTIGRWSVLVYFIQIFIGGYAFIVLCDLLDKIKYLADFLRFAGRNSLLFMFMHRPLGVVFADILNAPIKSGESWYVAFTPQVFMQSLIIFILSIISCSIFALTKGRIHHEVQA